MTIKKFTPNLKLKGVNLEKYKKISKGAILNL